MTWGIWRVRVLLPADSAIWTAEQRRAVLLHELAHARRWDCLTQLVAQLACALYWFNPLLWLAWKRMQSEREQACDDFVLGTGTKASAYAEQLLHIASQMPAVRYSAAAIAMARPSKLEGRLLAILDVKRNRRSMKRRAVLFAGAVALALAIPVACMRASGPANQAAKPAATQPASNSSRRAATADDPWRVRLANGVTVAVVGATTQPSAGQAWWRPDGSPLGYQPDQDDAQLAQLAKERPALSQVAVRLDDMPASKDVGARDTAVFVDGKFATDPTVPVIRKINSHSLDGKTQSLWMILMPSFPSSQERTTMRIGAATGSWEPIADGTYDGTAWTVHPAGGKGATNIDVSFAGPYGVGSPQYGYGMAPGYTLRQSGFGVTQQQQAFVVTAALTLPADRQVCLVGIAADGTETVAGMTPQISDGHVQQVAGYFDGLADFAAVGFKAFRVESRPIEFAEFKDVALAPAAQAATQPAAALPLPGFGHVVDMQGRPIAGASVRDWNSGWSAVSGADGSFPLPEIPVKSGAGLSLDVTATGFVRRSASVVRLGQAGQGIKPEDCILPMHRFGRVEGRLLGPDGKPIIGTISASVNEKYPDYSQRQNDVMSAASDALGQFVIENVPPGDLLLVCPAGPNKPAPKLGHSGYMALHVDDGQIVRDVVLDLSKSVGIAEGRVEDHDGKPVAGADVFLCWRYGGGVMKLDMPREVAPVTTDADGHFRLQDLPMGDWAVQASIAGVDSPAMPVTVSQTPANVGVLDLQVSRSPTGRIRRLPPMDAAMTVREWIDATLAGDTDAAAALVIANSDFDRHSDRLAHLLPQIKEFRSSTSSNLSGEVTTNDLDIGKSLHGPVTFKLTANWGLRWLHIDDVVDDTGRSLVVDGPLGMPPATRPGPVNEVAQTVSRLGLDEGPTDQPDSGWSPLDKHSVDIQLVADDKSPAGIRAVAPFPLLRTMLLPDVYQQAVAGTIAAGHQMLVGRMSGVYDANDEFYVSGFLHKGNRLAVEVQYVRVAPQQATVLNNPKRAYFQAPIPQDLPPGRYYVWLQLQEYQREGGKLTLYAADSAAFEYLTCMFDVPDPAGKQIDWLLPGSQLSVAEAMKQNFAFAAVCQTGDLESPFQFDESAEAPGHFTAVQTVQVGDNLVGAFKPGPAYLVYSWLDTDSVHEAMPVKPRSVIWICRHGVNASASFQGIKALADTPENRRAVIAAGDALRRGAAATQPAAGDMPTWEQLQALMGQAIDSPAVRDFELQYGVTYYGTKDSATGVIADFKSRPFYLQHDYMRIVKVGVLVSPDSAAPNRRPYTGALPHGVTVGDKAEDVIGRLGPPTDRPNPDTLVYKGEGLWFSFDVATHLLTAVEYAGTQPSTQPAATQPATQPGMRLVDDPVAAIRAVLPDGLVIQQVNHDSSPYGFEPYDGRGLGITINLSPAELARAPQQKGIAMPLFVSIMPPDYQGRVMHEVALQFAPARKVASTPQGDIFVWGGNWGAISEDIEPKVLAALLVGSPPATRPAGATTQHSDGD